MQEPVTVLCVGIATEDGSFLSGLHHRFELGHLYPNDEVAEATELSPVCISTECWGADGVLNGSSASLLNDDDDDNDTGSAVDRKYSEDDDDSSCDCSDEAASSAHKCGCIFNGVGEKVSALDEEKPRRI